MKSVAIAVDHAIHGKFVAATFTGRGSALDLGLFEIFEVFPFLPLLDLYFLLLCLSDGSGCAEFFKGFSFIWFLTIRNGLAELSLLVLVHATTWLFHQLKRKLLRFARRQYFIQDHVGRI